MVRLKDIAEKAGVSVMTVSKVLRDAPDVSAATKVRIRRLAEEMGYVPDSMAQGLRSRTTKLLGVVIAALTHPVLSPIVSSLEERAHQLGYEVIVTQSLNLPEREDACLRRLLARRIDGLFVAPIYRLAPTASIFAEIEKRQVPTVILGQRAPFCAKFPTVETDDVAGSHAATRHLLELGHRRIACLAGPSAAPWAQERLDGYRKALRERGLDSADNLIYTAGTNVDDGEKAALQMLHESGHPTAILAANDRVAIGAAGVLLKQGLRIPQDVSIVGFGNNPMSEHFRVPLTTVRQPKTELGVVAVESMMEYLQGARPSSKRLATELIVRESTGPAPREAVVEVRHPSPDQADESDLKAELQG